MTQKIYFAGELFSLKHLAGNALLAKAILNASEGRYLSVLPQMLEQRDTTENAIRNQDLKALISSDLAVFNFDGDEIDSGTVAEYMVAKFIDLPSVIVRTDFRARSDSRSAPWNLMLSFYPRTEVLTFDGMELYQKQIQAYPSNDYISQINQSVDAANAAFDNLSTSIVEALDRVSAIAPRLTGNERNHVIEWALKMPGSGFEKLWSAPEKEALLGDR